MPTLAPMHAHTNVHAQPVLVQEWDMTANLSMAAGQCRWDETRTETMSHNHSPFPLAQEGTNYTLSVDGLIWLPATCSHSDAASIRTDQNEVRNREMFDYS